MDWKATGRKINTAKLDLAGGRDRHSPIGKRVTLEPTRAKLEKNPAAAGQVDFACNALGEAVLAGILDDGLYEIEMGGSAADDETDSTRPSLYLRFTPAAPSSSRRKA